MGRDMAALAKRQRPTLLLEVDRLDAANLGVLFMHYMMTTSYFAPQWEVNAYDQPAV